MRATGSSAVSIEHRSADAMIDGGTGPSTRTIVRIALTIAGTAIALYLLWLIRQPLLLVFIAGFLAIALGPPVDYFARRGFRRPLAILTVYFLMRSEEHTSELQ